MIILLPSLKHYVDYKELIYAIMKIHEGIHNLFKINFQYLIEYLLRIVSVFNGWSELQLKAGKYFECSL